MKCCHGVKPRGRRVTWVEGASGPRLSKHNHFLYFEHTQGLKDGLPVPDCQSRCHCKLSSLMAPDCQRLWGESTKENSSSSWQAGLLTNYLFFFPHPPPPLPSRLTGELTCVRLAAPPLCLLAPLIKCCFVTPRENAAAPVDSPPPPPPAPTFQTCFKVPPGMCFPCVPGLRFI